MKNVLKAGVILMLISTAAFGFVGCFAGKCTGTVEYFRYSRNGSWMDGYSVTVKKNEDGAYRFIYSEDQSSEYGEMEIGVDADFVLKLTDICNRYSIRRWNGFRKSNRNVLDGSGFSLNVDYEGGGEISADGYMRYPRGFKEFRDEIMDLCSPYIEQAKQEKM